MNMLGRIDFWGVKNNKYFLSRGEKGNVISIYRSNCEMDGSVPFYWQYSMILFIRVSCPWKHIIRFEDDVKYCNDIPRVGVWNVGLWEKRKNSLGKESEREASCVKLAVALITVGWPGMTR